MERIKDILLALRREIEEGLRPEAASSRAAGLEVDRVSVTLRFATEGVVDANGAREVALRALPGGTGAGQKGAEPGQGWHEVTLELKQAGSRRRGAGALTDEEGMEEGADSYEEAALEGAEAQDAEAVLRSVFGPPGFDSSARASVCREAMEELDPDEQAVVVDALQGRPVPATEPSVERLLHVLTLIFRNGPLKSEARGRKLFGALLSKYSMASLISLTGKLWKTQKDWLDAPVSGGESHSRNGDARA